MPGQQQGDSGRESGEMPDERGSFRRVIARQIGEGKPVSEKSGCTGVDVAAQTPVPGPAKMFETASKRADLGLFLAAFCVELRSFSLPLNQLSVVRCQEGMDDAGERTKAGADEAGCRDAVLSSCGEGEESDQWTAAGGASCAACSVGGDRGEDGGEPFGDFRPGGRGA